MSEERPTRLKLVDLVPSYRTDIYLASEHMGLYERGYTGTTAWDVTGCILKPSPMSMLWSIRNFGVNHVMPLKVVHSDDLLDKRMSLPDEDRHIPVRTTDVPSGPVLIDSCVEAAALLYLGVQEVDVVYCNRPDYKVRDHNTAIRYDMAKISDAMVGKMHKSGVISQNPLLSWSYVPGWEPYGDASSLASKLWEALAGVGMTARGKRTIFVSPGCGMIPHSFLQLGGEGAFCIEEDDQMYYIGQFISNYHFPMCMYMWERPSRTSILTAPGNYDLAVLYRHNVGAHEIGTIQDMVVSLSNKASVVAILTVDESEGAVRATGDIIDNHVVPWCGLKISASLSIPRGDSTTYHVTLCSK